MTTPHSSSDTDGIDHPYHLVQPSAWPILGAGGAWLLACGALLYIHQGIVFVLFLGFLGIFGVMIGWWAKVIKESVGLKRAYAGGEDRNALWDGVVYLDRGDVFCGIFFWAFYNASLFPKVVDPGGFSNSGSGGEIGARGESAGSLAAARDRGDRSL